MDLYKTMLVFKSRELRDEIINLQIWGESSGFEISTIVDNGKTALDELKKQNYDLVIMETEIPRITSLQLLRAARKEELCSHIVLCSEDAHFEYARQGMILGAFDYFVKPFEMHQFYSMFTRIKNEEYENSAFEILCTEEIVSCFERYESNIKEHIENSFAVINSKYSRQSAADNAILQITENAAAEVFSANRWLSLYVSENILHNYSESSGVSVQSYCMNKLAELYSDYSEIMPKVQNKKILEIILYIIENPEGDLRQKTIANNLYLSSSYLSTVFSAHTGKRFVDYLTAVRMKRASWLLCNTDLKITEIAERLDYKDIGYFSRIFKKIYMLSPSEYRTLENCSFDI